MVKHNLMRQWVLGAAAVVAMLAGAAQGQYREDVFPEGKPAPMKNPETVFKPNAALPLDTTFTLSDGTATKLSGLLKHGRPVVVLMVYFSCPNMCDWTQDSLAAAVHNGPRG